MSHSSPVASDPAASKRWRSVRDRLQAAALHPEESILLRTLVQLLVSVGIASVTVASIGVTQASYFNLLAIPLSAFGGYWSWRARYRRNISVKFFIAFGMLTALGVFLAGLVSGGGDTRVQLAELLIHLQVLHSFDMPRRKDLGYSIVIGLILLGVAATVSQSLTFAPLLILFLAIALPVLMLDYQSRLGLAAVPTSRELGTAFSLKRLVWLLVLIIGLGLVIFAALPRVPGYQIRNFPVSTTIDFQGDFSGNQIVNSGYASETGTNEGFEEGEGGGGDPDAEEGTSPTEGPGTVDNTTYYGFNKRINQNLRGTITPQVVMRVRSQAPGFWRVLAFDRYTGQGWEVSRDDQVEILNRSNYSFRNYLPAAAFVSKHHNTQGREREVVQTYTVVNNLPSLIPALYQAEQLYFPARQVAIDAEGSLRSPIPLTEGITYSVVSDVPYRDRTQLRHASTEYDEALQTAYLQVPETIRDRVRQHTEDLLAQSANPLTDPYEQTLYLAQALKQNYTVQNDLPFFSDDEDLVEAFLFNYEGGYTDHFSTVLTVMLRSIGIPSRLVTGFAPGRFNPFTGYYVVQNVDAYAMTEVFFPGYGWFGFDPIPGHEVLPPSIKDSQTFTVLRQFWNWIAGWLPSPVSGWLTGVFTWMIDLFSRILKFFSEGLVGFLAALLSLTGLAFIAWLMLQGWRRWHQHRQLSQLPLIERIYQHLLNWLAAQGYPKRSAQTPLEYAIHLHDVSRYDKADDVMDVTQLYMRWRYGNVATDPDQLQQRVNAIQRSRSR
jgi:transglutaminase-like putative cysteine protease